MVVVENFKSSVYPLTVGSFTLPVYAAVAGLVVNLLLCIVLTIIFKGAGIVAGEDDTAATDYEVYPVPVIQSPQVYVKPSEVG